MVRRISPSEFRNKLRQLENAQRQAINRYNADVRRYNQAVRTQVQNINNAIDRYNSAARAHNANVRASRARIASELSRLQRAGTATTHVRFQVSVQAFHTSYSRLERWSDEQETLHPQQEAILDLSENEATNGLAVMNALLDPADSGRDEKELQDTIVADELRAIAPDLDNRWRGALFSLNPRNPDAARHFCTSARELFAQILDIRAPDSRVLEAVPNCAKTSDGRVARRAKIEYLLSIKNAGGEPMAEFVDSDISNIMELFQVFNDGTHGSSGKFTLNQLVSIKKRVEGGVLFLAKIAA